jgi:hypothetical protein
MAAREKGGGGAGAGVAGRGRATVTSVPRPAGPGRAVRTAPIREITAWMVRDRDPKPNDSVGPPAALSETVT